MPLSIARDRLATLLEAARERRVIIVGDAMLDVYLRGDVERISPEAPVPVVRIRERGMALLAPDGSVRRVPTVAREVYDVVGAGDTVTAYLAAILAAGGTVDEAAIVANYAAGVEVGKLGAATVTADEVMEAYDAYMALQNAPAGW